MADRKAPIAAAILCLCFVRAQCDASPEQEQEIQMLKSKLASSGESSRVLFKQNIVVLTLFILFFFWERPCLFLLWMESQKHHL
jgi:Na+/H+ antiporter NhaD/arsenite permease-like protein